jgi:hypothetical protein
MAAECVKPLRRLLRMFGWKRVDAIFEELEHIVCAPR